MKIKTITCHKVYNYGAILQEYALVEYLKNMGYEVETINYTPNYLTYDFSFFANSSNPKYSSNLFVKLLYLIGKIPHRILALQRKKSFDYFEKKFIPSTNYNYKTNEELKKNLPIADAYICGSDQIWNSFFQNGKDPAFYLDFVPEDKLKISYAASFAIEEIEEELKPFVKEKVNKLNKISVRETSGINILNELGITKVTQVLDPVFLIDKEIWKEKFVKLIPEKYIFVYDMDSNEQIKKITKHVSKKYKLKIYTVSSNIKYADKAFYTGGPEMFLSLIGNATYVIGNSFHAVAFSLIFEKNFLVFDRNEQINTRMRDIMNLLDLSHLHLKIDEFKEIDTIDIDYKIVNRKLKHEIEKSKFFINSSIKQKEC